MVEKIDLTNSPRNDSDRNPFLNDDSDQESVIIELGHNYNLRNRIRYHLKVIKEYLAAIEVDLILMEPDDT